MNYDCSIMIFFLVNQLPPPLLHITACLWNWASMVVTTWCWLRVSPPQWPYQKHSCWCPAATRSPHPTEALKQQTGNATGLLSWNAPSEPQSSAWWPHGHRVGRERRHREKCRVGFFGADSRRRRRRKPRLRGHGAGSACTGASERSTPPERQSPNSFYWGENTRSMRNSRKQKLYVNSI